MASRLSRPIKNGYKCPHGRPAASITAGGRKARPLVPSLVIEDVQPAVMEKIYINLPLTACWDPVHYIELVKRYQTGEKRHKKSQISSLNWS
jgi:hypothetical protein